MHRLQSRVWSAANGSIVRNAASLVGTTGITSVLGFGYWGLATRRFAAGDVGFASASIAAMQLLGTLGTLGFGTLLIAELPRRPGEEGSAIATALLTTGLAGAAMGALFAILAPRVSPDLGPLARTTGVPLFATGVAFTSATLVLDQALIGLLRGGLQFWRNAIFAIAKLLVLGLVAFQVGHGSGMAIYATWTIGNVVSVAALGTVALRRSRSIGGFRPRARAARGAGRAALGHHALNIALQFPALVLPLVVTTVLSAAANAYFYAAWMVAGFVFVGPGALTVALYAVGTRDPAALARRARFTLALGAAGGVVANAALLVGAPSILRVFGASYAEEAGWALRIIGIGVFPVIIKDHYVTIHRLHGRAVAAARWVALGGALEVAAAAFGARVGGLTGLGVAWLVAACIEAVGMAATVVSTATGNKPTGRSARHWASILHPRSAVGMRRTKTR